MMWKPFFSQNKKTEITQNTAPQREVIWLRRFLKWWVTQMRKDVAKVIAPKDEE